MNKRKERQAAGIGALGAIRERPLIFTVLAVTFLSGALVAAHMLIKPPSNDIAIRTDIIDLDAEAKELRSLIRPAPLNSESLKDAILGRGSLDAAGLDDLAVLQGNQDGEFVIRLGGSFTSFADDTVNDRVQAFADDQNRRRAEQKAEAELWIKRRGQGWQTRIDEAKAAIARNSFDPALSQSPEGSESAKLLRLMIDATMEDQEKPRPIDTEGDRRLATDTDRLTQALEKLELGYEAQQAYETALKAAEAGLAEHIEEAAELVHEGGVLDRPAVTILMPTSAEAATLRQHPEIVGLPILLPAMGAASLTFALIGTWLVCRLRPPIEIAAGDHLNDPYWPLSPNAQRELSTGEQRTEKLSLSDNVSKVRR